MTPSRRNLLIGIIIGIFFAGVLFYFRSTISEQGPPFLIGFLTCLALLGILLIIGGIWFQKQIYERFFGQAPTESNVNQSLENTVGSFAKRYLPETTEKDVKSGVQLIQSFLWGRAVYTFIGVIISIFLVLGGLIGSVLLFKQNDLLNKQNERIDLQNNLLEAERRSSLIFLLSNVLDKVDDEIKGQRDSIKRNLGTVPDNVRYNLSKPLVSRIVALSRSLKPYRMMEGGILSELVSPERGQLFISLMQINLVDSIQNRIVKEGDFSLAVINSIDLSGAKLDGANLYGANLEGANLSGVNLNGANLENAAFNGNNLIRAKLRGASMKGAKLNDVDLTGADLIRTDLSSADLTEADLTGASLNEATLINANFTRAVLFRAELIGVSFQGVNLLEANLIKTNLRGCNFHNVLNLPSSDLKNTFMLFKCLNLPPDLEATLKKEKFCLFTEEGCN